jgi:hypothetical protein
MEIPQPIDGINDKPHCVSVVGSVSITLLTSYDFKMKLGRSMGRSHQAERPIRVIVHELVLAHELVLERSED